MNVGLKNHFRLPLVTCWSHWIYILYNSKPGFCARYIIITKGQYGCWVLVLKVPFPLPPPGETTVHNYRGCLKPALAWFQTDIGIVGWRSYGISALLFLSFSFLSFPSLRNAKWSDTCPMGFILDVTRRGWRYEKHCTPHIARLTYRQP